MAIAWAWRSLSKREGERKKSELANLYRKYPSLDLVFINVPTKDNLHGTDNFLHYNYFSTHRTRSGLLFRNTFKIFNKRILRCTTIVAIYKNKFPTRYRRADDERRTDAEQSVPKARFPHRNEIKSYTFFNSFISLDYLFELLSKVASSDSNENLKRREGSSRRKQRREMFQ